MSIKQFILKGIMACQVPFKDKDIATLVENVRAANPENLKGYAYICGRNWAISQARHAAAQVRVAMAQEAKALAERKERGIFLAAYKEFQGLVPEIVSSHRRVDGRTGATKMLEVVRLSKFLNISETELEKMCPATTRNQR